MGIAIKRFLPFAILKFSEIQGCVRRSICFNCYSSSQVYKFTQVIFTLEFKIRHVSLPHNREITLAENILIFVAQDICGVVHTDCSRQNPALSLSYILHLTLNSAPPSVIILLPRK